MNDELDELLKALSISEIVAHIRELGERSAHKGMTRSELKALYLTSFNLGPSKKEDPVDSLRRDVMSYIEARKWSITLSCNGDCFQHSAGKVVLCHLQLPKES